MCQDLGAIVESSSPHCHSNTFLVAFRFYVPMPPLPFPPYCHQSHYGFFLPVQIRLLAILKEASVTTNNPRNVRCVEKEMIKSTTHSLKRELAVNVHAERCSFEILR